MIFSAFFKAYNGASFCFPLFFERPLPILKQVDGTGVCIIPEREQKSDMTRVLIIHPPVAKPGEPPAGAARIRGFLEENHVSCRVLDAGLEGIRFLLQKQPEIQDTRTANAWRNRDRSLNALKSGSAFSTVDHYNRIVGSLNRLLFLHGRKYGYSLDLANCTHDFLSPLSSRDLRRCAEKPENDPFHDYYRDSLISSVRNYRPDMIGISVNFLSQAFSAFSLTGLLKREFPGCRIVAGGGLITSWMQKPDWNNPFSGLVDHCVRGSGEVFFNEILKLNVPGRRVSMPVYNDFYRQHYLSPGFVLPYNTSSGCYWNRCSFCPEPAEGSRYHPLPRERAVREIRQLCRVNRPVLIHFLDNALAPAFLKTLISNAPGVPWYGYVRFTSHFLDPDFCRKLKASGCAMLKIGLESGDQRVLDHLNKGIDLKMVSKSLFNLHQAGIPLYIYLLFGTPHESEESAGMTMRFVADHHECINYINPAVFNMPAAGHEARLYHTRYFSGGDLSLYVDFHHPLGWDRIRVRHFLDRVLFRHPDIAGIRRMTPKTFTSSHAPFFHLDIPQSVM